jgi:hypothetical protein
MLDVPTDSRCETTARYCKAVESHDIDGVLATLAPHAVLRSPITNRIAFRGHEEIRPLLESVFGTLQGTEFFADIGDDRTRALFHRARVGGQPVEEVSRVQLGEDGLIEEITLYVRPLPGLATMAACLAPRVAARRGRARSLLARLLIFPLGRLTRLGDRLVPWFV